METNTAGEEIPCTGLYIVKMSIFYMENFYLCLDPFVNFAKCYTFLRHAVESIDIFNNIASTEKSNAFQALVSGFSIIYINA